MVRSGKRHLTRGEHGAIAVIVLAVAHAVARLHCRRQLAEWITTVQAGLPGERARRHNQL